MRVKEGRNSKRGSAKKTLEFFRLLASRNQKNGRFVGCAFHSFFSVVSEADSTIIPPKTTKFWLL
jgi:hypothetical protein